MSDPTADAPAREPFAETPEPPYWAVIFSSRRSADGGGYDSTAARMVELAATQPGFLGIESARDADGFGITVSYWSDLDAIAGWKRHGEHLEAQAEGRRRWYERYEIRVARVERTRGRAR